MNIIKFIYQHKSYSYGGSSNLQAGVVGLFLTDDVSDWTETWRDWINNDKYEYTSSNITFLRKQGDSILLEFLFADDDDTQKKIILKRTVLLELLEQWKYWYEHPCAILELVVAEDQFKFTCLEPLV